jgi:hypothetical protein
VGLVRSYLVAVLHAALPVGYIQMLVQTAWQGGAGCCGVLEIGLTKNGLQLGHSLLRELGG